MKRSIFESEHERFRSLARAFCARECAPRTGSYAGSNEVMKEIVGRSLVRDR
jgi:hypothetical protein